MKVHFSNKTFFYGIFLPLFAFLLIIIIVSVAKSQETEGMDIMSERVQELVHPMDWITKYKGRLPPGMGCCGHNDCVPVNLRILEQKADTYDIEFFYKTGEGPFRIFDFPIRAVYVSEDENDYFCFVPFYHGSIGMPPPSGDPCIKDPRLECSNCFFYSPKT